MQRITAVRASNASISFPYVPTAVIIGGTSGIGQGIAEAFARHTKGNAHIILVGRNRAAAESIISTFPRPSISPSASDPGVVKPKHEFLSCDATLMQNVSSASSQLLQLAPKINFLILCPGFSTLGWEETKEEGLDKRMALHYYARWKFIQDLMPALINAQQSGEDAKVMSLLTTNRSGPKVNLDDLGLKKSKPFSTSIMTTIYSDLMFDELTLRHPTLTFVHAYPGWVRTNIGSASPSAFIRGASKPVQGLLKPWMTPKEDVGEFLLHGLIRTASKPGSWRLNEFGEVMVGKHEYAEDLITRKKLWEHTEEVMQMTCGQRG
ncbi:hypothetical protein GYMLUDRAFT_220927 [Collybiopsis luxurians FD-317 M1]|nr:hypothetical protein GYMLUDRAFT_220927 [Collybiopsis luxurians FD-317 M1]